MITTARGRYFEIAASFVMAEIELPDFLTMLANCSLDSLRRLRRTLTCTLSLKSNELRKKVGRRLFMWFSRDDNNGLVASGN